VFLHWHNGGHELGQDDVDAAKLWIARQNFQTDA
jgi:predicted esterase